MKRSKTSVTILAALTIGLSGSLKVLALCSMYRTSHISAEILLKKKQPNKTKKNHQERGSEEGVHNFFSSEFSRIPQ